MRHKAYFHNLLILICCIFSFAYAQSPYKPDTSLTYDRFLQQCIQFKRETRQEVWVVSFWASWDNKWENYAFRLKDIHKRFADKPIRFVSISIDQNEDSWYKSLFAYRMDWEQLVISNQTDLSFIKRAFPFDGIPSIFVVSPDGSIRRRNQLADLENELEYHSSYLGVAPPTKPVAEEKPKPETQSWLTHKVQKGETLYRIFVRYGVSVDEIKRINNLSNNSIVPGQVLKIKRQ